MNESLEQPKPMTDETLATRIARESIARADHNDRDEINELTRERDELQRQLAEAQSMLKIRDAQLQRLSDLVRYQRSELHRADLITYDEYCELLSDNKAVARLETYDDLRKQLAAEREAREKAEKALEQEKAWKIEDPRMLREQIRVADVAFQALHERHQALLKESGKDANHDG